MSWAKTERKGQGSLSCVKQYVCALCIQEEAKEGAACFWGRRSLAGCTQTMGKLRWQPGKGAQACNWKTIQDNQGRRDEGKYWQYKCINLKEEILSLENCSPRAWCWHWARAWAESSASPKHELLSNMSPTLSWMFSEQRWFPHFRIQMKHLGSSEDRVPAITSTETLSPKVESGLGELV